MPKDLIKIRNKRLTKPSWWIEGTRFPIDSDLKSYTADIHFADECWITEFKALQMDNFEAWIPECKQFGLDIHIEPYGDRILLVICRLGESIRKHRKRLAKRGEL